MSYGYNNHGYNHERHDDGVWTVFAFALAAIFLFFYIFAYYRADNAFGDEQQYIRCTNCHVVNRTMSGSFVCSSCATPNRSVIPNRKPAVPSNHGKIREISFPSKYLSKMSNSYFDVKPINDAFLAGVRMNGLPQSSPVGSTTYIDYNEPGVCHICLSVMDDRENVLIPCGHAGMCRTCIDKVLLSSSECPICRTHIDYATKAKEGVVSVGRVVKMSQDV